MSLRIGLLGGSFNPPHIGHLYISLETLKYLNLHQVWWLFCRNNPLKQIRYAPFDLRAKRARELIKTNKKIKLINSDDIYTYRTIRKLTSKYPQHDFTWIAGMDSVISIPLWENWEEIIRKVRFVLFYRKNFFHKCMRSKFFLHPTQKQVFTISNKRKDISSTFIREKEKWDEHIPGT